VPVTRRTDNTQLPHARRRHLPPLRTLLIDSAAALHWTVPDGVATLGISVGASAPEALVHDLLARLGGRYALAIEERRVTAENVRFRLPAELA